MRSFPLQIVTADGLHFDGEAEKLLVRTITGDVCILAKHCDYVTALGMGEAQLTTTDGQTRRAACIGGMLAVNNGRVRLLPTTFEWADQIDQERAERAAERARERIAQGRLSKQELELAQAHLKRALVRSSVAKRK